MKRTILLALLCSLLFPTTALAQKAAVVYFSATGTTKAVATRIASITEGKLYAITPATPYTSADLDWKDKQSRSSIEMNDPKARPALKKSSIELKSCDIIFLGYPIWWNSAPRIINTFIESHDLKGKTIVPFATSGSSSITASVAALRKAYPDLKWESGRLLNDVSDKQFREWLGKYGF